jgi:hypothetical protein
VRRAQAVPTLLIALLVSATAWAEEEPEEQLERIWSTTLIGDITVISDPYANDDVGSFFDQYEFTPNKSSSFPFELGIRDLSYDVFAPGQTPKLQFRFESPTSNLGISGSQIDQPFLNQRALLLGRLTGIDIDVRYWRFRTEDLRWFPTTVGRQFDDLTSPSDRFNRDRTGFDGEIRIRPHQLSDRGAKHGEWLAPELSLRGGFDGRDGKQQLGFMLSPSNRWGALSQPLDQSAAQVGGGLLVAPGGLFTMTFDVDYERFRQNSSDITEQDLGPSFPQTSDTVGFIPDSDRITGTVQLQSRIGERTVVEAGFQVSRLEQVDNFTPMQIASGLQDNELKYYSANLGLDMDIADRLSLNAFFKFDQRNNKIQRDTDLFNPLDGSQVDQFLKQWNRIYTGAEAVYELHRGNLVALGARYEWIDRDLRFAVPTNLVILEPNALMSSRTEMWTVYGRTSLRPLKGLSVSAELGYTGAPRTGYILDLDDRVYGKLRASYVIPLKRPIVLSAFANGSSGENRDFSMVSGIGPIPAGPELQLAFDRWNVAWGLTATTSPWKKVSVFASFFRACSGQEYGLDLSSLQRYFQPSQLVLFFQNGATDYQDKQMSLVLGTHARFSDKTDGGLSYSFTQAQARYDSSVPSADLLLISNSHVIDSDIHGIRMEVGHWLRPGLRALVGYRLDLLSDSAPLPSGTGSVVAPIERSMNQHTITLGITLTSDLLAKAD